MTSKVVDDVGAEKKRGNSESPNPHLGCAKLTAEIEVFGTDALMYHFIVLVKNLSIFIVSILSIKGKR